MAVQWTPFKRRVPENAVVGGYRKDGTPIYLGRVFAEGEILPSKVIPQFKAAYVSCNGKEIAKKEFEVLCCTGKSISWKQCHHGEVPLRAFDGGSTKYGEKLYFGRVLHDGSLTPGKVVRSHGCCYIPYNGNEVSSKSYEVLEIV